MSDATDLNLSRPPLAPSDAAKSIPPESRSSRLRTSSWPAVNRPARRANWSNSTHRRASSASTRSARSVSTRTLHRARLANRFFAQAVCIISRSALNHNPRPGSFASRSGTIFPSGPITNRTMSSFGFLTPLAMQVLKPCSSVSGAVSWLRRIDGLRFRYVFSAGSSAAASAADSVAAAPASSTASSLTPSAVSSSSNQCARAAMIIVFAASKVSPSAGTSSNSSSPARSARSPALSRARS